jgi:hypothetical protein
LQKYFVLISHSCSGFTKPNFYGYLLLSTFSYLDDEEVDSDKARSTLLRRDAMPTESHSDGQHVGYFPITLLLALGYSEHPLFIGTLRLLHGNSYL